MECIDFIVIQLLQHLDSNKRYEEYHGYKIKHFYYDIEIIIKW